ncbi:MAG: VCBS repeat-containing protein [Flavobacteriales bacterium]|nr:VCBS repeat-containing protein [Flavobacteriales bacterium]
MKKNLQNKKKYFNQYLLLYKKYQVKLQRLISLSKNKHRQEVLRNHLSKLAFKLQSYNLSIRKIAALACLGGGLLLSNAAHSQVNFKIGLGDQIGFGIYSPDPELVDLDNDGDLDILIGSYNSNSINSVYYSENIGTATEPEFTEAVLNTFGLEFPINVYSAVITSGDMDGDGDFDIIASEYYGQIYYFENTGTATSPAFATGVLAPFGLPTTGGYGFSVTLADLDNDGDLDLMTNLYSDHIYYENTGTATLPAFGAGQTNPFGLTTSGYSYAQLAFSDMDLDGDLDLVVGGSGSTNLEYYENIGTVTVPNFAAPNAGITGLIESPAISSAPEIGDLNNDGYPDIIKGRSPRRFKVYFNKALPTTISYEEHYAQNPFSIVDISPGGNVGFGYPAFTDLDNDGDQDMLVGKFGGGFAYFQNVGTSTVPVFAYPVSNAFGLTAGGTKDAPTFADVDGDGDQDIITNNDISLNPHLSYIENIGTASAPNFAAPVSANTALGIPFPGNRSKPRFVDLDGDGDQDMFVGVRYGNFRYYENTGTLTAPNYGMQQSNPFGLASLGTSEADLSPTFSDADGDGDLDLIVGLNNSDNLYYENIGTSSVPSFAAPLTNPHGIININTHLNLNNNWYVPSFVDIDGDGDDDIISAIGTEFYFYENVSNTSPCTVNIPDANFKTYLVGNTAINTGGDPNEIECSEAAAFTGSVNAGSQSINNIIGIEAFVNLTGLVLYSNPITTVDLSQNTALTTINLSYCDLSALDVSNLINLTSLYAYDNVISSLILPSNSILTTILIPTNALTNLDVSNQTSLVQINVQSNALLSSLNVANGNNTNFTSFNAVDNPNLTCIQVDDATYSTTNWTNIDATSSFSANCGTVGVNEITQTLELTTYPNPTTGKVIFSTTEQISSIEIYNLTGQKVATFNNTNTIDISNLTNGVYFAKIITATNNPVMQKIIKE